MTEPPHVPYPSRNPAPPVNTYAILSLVFSLAVFPPVGVYLGNKAKEQIAETGERGIELANIGVVAGWILSVLYVGFVVVWCGFAGTILSHAGR
jgi:hypothetical protein